MRRSSLIEEIKETADKLARDNASRGDLKILSRALKELRYAFKVFTPYRRHRKVTVFGSARTTRSSALHAFPRIRTADGRKSGWC